MVNLYEQLHAVKVCHRDVKLSHILHTGCDGLGCKYFRLIDFEGAKMECSSQEMEQEMERVRWIARQGR
jgi:thiamine kinase-like enzyme